MPVLVWDQLGDRLYETGISRGVLYEEDGNGIAWNGLTSVEEAVATEIESVYFDGVKFNDIVTIGEFNGILRAFTYPEEFLFYEGTIEEQMGFYVTNQPQSKFGLCYRTETGNDINEQEGYKIHVLYNLTALPSQRSYQTLGAEISPLEFEWNIYSIPEEIENLRPSSHIVFDSRRIDSNLLSDIEDILYGTEESSAYLPSLKGLATFIRKWDRLIITDIGNGMWTAESNAEGVIEMLDETTFEITSDTAVYLDADTYEISSSEKNEEDI